MIEISPSIQLDENELQFSYVRATGPGGQNVNKVATSASLRWPVLASGALPDDVRQRFLDRYRNRITSEGEFLLTSQRYRDAGRNVDDCFQRLREMLAAVAQPPTVRKRTRPSKASVRRRLDQKRHQAQKKQGRRTALD